MENFRHKLPVLYCILAYILWFIGAYSVSSLSGHLPFASAGFSSVASEFGGVIMMLLLLGVTGRLRLLKEKGMGLLKGTLLGFAMLGLGLMAFIAEVTSNTQPFKEPAGIILFLFLPVSIGLTEELLCRGVMAETLLEAFGTKRSGIYKAILISSLLFGLSHLSNLSSGASLIGVLTQVLSGLGSGVLLAAIYFRSGNLWAPIIVHILWDFCTIAGTGQGLYVSKELVSDRVSHSFSPQQFILSGFFIAIAFLILHSKKQIAQVEKWFAPYCSAKQKEN